MHYRPHRPKVLNVLLLVMAIIPLSGLTHRPPDTLEKIKYRNFSLAINNGSTFQFFTVIKVKDIGSNTIKEICTKGSFINGAIYKELKLDHYPFPKSEEKTIEWALSKKDRYFEFKDRNALENISFFSYDTQLVRKVQRKYEFDQIEKQIKTTGQFSIRLKDDEMKAFAHVLFNRGYLTGENNCFGGTLEYIDKTHLHNL